MGSDIDVIAAARVRSLELGHDVRSNGVRLPDGAPRVQRPAPVLLTAHDFNIGATRVIPVHLRLRSPPLVICEPQWCGDPEVANDRIAQPEGETADRAGDVDEERSGCKYGSVHAVIRQIWQGDH